MSSAFDPADGLPSGPDQAVVSTPARPGLAGAAQAAVAFAAFGALAVGAAQMHGALQKPVIQAAARTFQALGPPPSLAGPADKAVDAVDSAALLHTLLTEAGLRPNLDVRRLSWTQARRVNALFEPNAPADAARPFVLSVDTKEGRQALHCLTQAAYFEAGANGPEAEAAVVQVVLNRMRHPDFPKSVCGVVYQGSARKTGCQFTFTCDGALKRGLDIRAWNEARKVALRALEGYVMKDVGASTYYHADYVFPVWAPTLVKSATIGPHIFYRMTGAAGTAAFLTGRYAGGELKLSKTILRATDGLTQKKAAPARHRAGEPVLQQASASGPKGLKVQAERNGRIHAVIAAAAAPTERAAAADQSGPAQAKVAEVVAEPRPEVAAPGPTPVAEAGGTPAA